MSLFYSIQAFEELIYRIEQIRDFNIYLLYKRHNNKDLKYELEKIRQHLHNNNTLTHWQWKIIKSVNTYITQDYNDIEDSKKPKARIHRVETKIEQQDIIEKINHEHVKKPGTTNKLYTSATTTKDSLKQKEKKPFREDVISEKQATVRETEIESSGKKEKKPETKETFIRFEPGKETPASDTSRENISTKSGRIKYTYYADTPGGFSQEALSDNPTGNMIYKLNLITSNKGRYSISSNPNAQRKALNNSSFLLEKACDYLNGVDEGSRIETPVEGEIMKSGSEWKITKKAKIKFV